MLNAEARGWFQFDQIASRSLKRKFCNASEVLRKDIRESKRKRKSEKVKEQGKLSAMKTNSPQVKIKKAVAKKLLKVKNRHYFAEGLTMALTSFFAVSEGPLDIQMVHEGTILTL